MRIKKIKSQIKKLAKEFNLKFDDRWFDYLWVTKRDEIILQYIGSCLDNVYDRYGNYPKERIKNISNFFNESLKKLSARYGGEVYSKEQLLYQKKLSSQIKNEEIKEGIIKLLGKIKKRLRKKRIALITKTNIKKEKKEISKILRHEWIHILLHENNIYFAKYSPKFWKYDEGLCTYMEAFLDNSIDSLEKELKKRKYPYEKKYLLYAIKFRRLLKNKPPQEREKAFFNLVGKLKGEPQKNTNINEIKTK